jgi:branched-chain amino acid transport system ATP-binding protein
MTTPATAGTARPVPARGALELTGVSAGYGRFDVVHDISLRVAEGETVALLGPNGAGKTTLLKALMGLLRQRTGQIRVRDADISAMPSHRIGRGHLALAPEGRRLFADQSVEDNLRLGAYRFGRDSARITALAETVYELFPVLRDYRRRKASDLSGGEQQMVAIGRMMMSDPAVMLLDEPSLGLAPLAVEAVVASLRRLRESGRSVLVVEQRVDIALDLSDRYYVMTGGRIVRAGNSADTGPAGEAVIEAFLG